MRASNRIILIIFIALGLINLNVQKIFSDDIINQDSVIDNATPKIKLESPTVVSINAGEKKDIELIIRNVGAAPAYNNLTQAVVDASAPFSINFISESNSVPVIAATGRKIMNLHIETDINAKSGSYYINLNHAFSDKENNNYDESDSFSIKVINNSHGPDINILEFNNSRNKIMPGDEFSLSALLANSSLHDGREVKIWIEGLELNKISLVDSEMGNYFADYRAGLEKILSFKFIASDKIKSGSYELIFKLEYKDSEDKLYEKSFYYYVSINSASQVGGAQVELFDIISPVKIFSVGETASISMKLKNIGLINAKNIKITAEPDDTDGAIVPKSSNVILTRELEVNETREINFDFAATTKSKTQNYVIKFLVEYENGNYDDQDKAEINFFEQYVGININNPDEINNTQSKPKVIINGYSTDPMIVTAGSEFDLNLSFKNTHKNKRVENAKVSLVIDEAVTSTNEQQGNIFTPINGSTSFFIGDIAPGDIIKKKLRLYTLPMAISKNYAVDVNLEYEDENHLEITYSEKIGINVKQAIKLEIGEINIPKEILENQPGVVSFDFYNTGRVSLNNLLIKLEGEGLDVKQSAVYYGKVNTNTSDSYEGDFIPLKAGEQQGKIIITFEDDAGEEKKETRDFIVNVKQKIEEISDGDNMIEKENKKSLLDRLDLWFGLISFLLIICYYVIKFIKHKKRDEKNLED